MLKKNLSEMTIRFIIVPKGPILIKSGVEGGADPTLPDMNFVRTTNPDSGEKSVYLPGSSLKGIFRSYAEKISKTIGLPIEDIVENPGAYEHLSKKKDTERYEQSDCIAKLFGSQVFASRIRFKDAFPVDEVTIEHRTNVSIDRKLNKVKAGPFQMEVVTSGNFRGEISIRNFELWQIGLLGLIFRDFNDGQIKIGYAKSRGLGDVVVNFTDIEIDISYSKLAYIKVPNSISKKNGNEYGKILGLDKLLPEEATAYDIKTGFDDLSLEVEIKDKDGWGINLSQEIRGVKVVELLKECVEKQWAKLLEGVTEIGK